MTLSYWPVERKRSQKSSKCIWIFNKFRDFILDFPSVPFSFQIFVFKTTLYIRVAHSEQRLGLFESTILCKITLRCKVLSNKITTFKRTWYSDISLHRSLLNLLRNGKKMNFTLKYESFSRSVRQQFVKFILFFSAKKEWFLLCHFFLKIQEKYTSSKNLKFVNLFERNKHPRMFY